MASYYTMTIQLVERGSRQDYLQGKVYKGIIQISVSTSEGKRTWDNNAGSWKEYTE